MELREVGTPAHVREATTPVLGLGNTSRFHTALLDLGELHDKEVQSLREEFAAAAASGYPSEAATCALRSVRGTSSDALHSTFAAKTSLDTGQRARKGALGRMGHLSPSHGRWGGSSWSSSWEGPGAWRRDVGRVHRATWQQSSLYGGSRNRLESVCRAWSNSEMTRLSTCEDCEFVKVRVLHAIVSREHFDALCSVMIVGNAVLMGVVADWRVRNGGEEVPEAFRVCDRIFTFWFLAEVLLRVGGHGSRFFRDPSLRGWNLFDLAVVAADVATMLLNFGAPEGSAAGGLPLVRLMRVLRIMRALLIVRIFRFFRELRMMVFSVLRSGTSLIWALVLFALNLYLFSVFFTGQVAAFKKEHAGQADTQLGRDLDKFFGTLLDSMHILFLSVTGGINWGELNAPLQQLHWSNSLVFTFFIFFTLFALTNIITGIFVDTAIQSAQGDREEVIQTQLYNRYSTLQQLWEILQAADVQNTGMITLADLESLLKNKKVRAHMAALELHLEDARELFRLLDPGRLGAVAIEEFVFGCMRLKGSARSIDLATLMYENKKMLRALTAFFDYAEQEFEGLAALAKPGSRAPVLASSEAATAGEAPLQEALVTVPERRTSGTDQDVEVAEAFHAPRADLGGRHAEGPLEQGELEASQIMDQGPWREASITSSEDSTREEPRVPLPLHADLGLALG